MKVWLVVAKVSEIQARSVEKVFDSEEKANKYVREQEKGEMPNLFIHHLSVSNFLIYKMNLATNFTVTI